MKKRKNLISFPNFFILLTLIDGEEMHIQVPVGMSMLEAAHENNIELQGACQGSLACSTCHVIMMDVGQYNKSSEPTHVLAMAD